MEVRFVEQQDATTYFRAPISAADASRFQHEWAVQQQRDHNAAVIGWSVIALIGLLLALAAVLHRRKIARAADAAVIAALATGVRAARKAQSRRASWVARVLEKADEKTPPSN